MTEIVQEYNVGKFRGNFPDVDIADGVDMAAIRMRDADPMFVTLPIAEIGAVSNNGLLYDESLVDSIAEQINAKRPGGIFGHLKEGDRSTSFPLPAGLWVGAKKVGATLWAKSYIPPSAARDYVQNLKDVGGEIATSIYGKGKFEKVRDGVKRLTSFDLESLDFAPPSRAALGFGAMPFVTAEMEQEQEAEMPVDKAQIISELTVDDIPAKLREAIVAETLQESETAQTISELTNTVKAKDEVIAELQTVVDEYRVAAINTAIDAKVAELTDWQVANDEGKEKLKTLRNMLRKQIALRMGDDQQAERVAEIADAAFEDIKPIAELVRDALAGPSAVVNGRVHNDNGRKPLEDTPEARQQARAAMGI